MQINSVSTTVPVSFAKPVQSPKATEPAADQVSISDSAGTFSSLVSQVGEMPEVRGEMVDAYKVRIQAGYPGPLDVEGLANFMGASWSAFSTGSE